MRRPSKLTKKTSQTALDRVARAVDALRAGRAVTIAGKLTVWAVETAPPAALDGKTLLIVTHARARTLKIRLYTPGVVALPVTKEMDLRLLRAIADPTADLDLPFKGP